MGALQRIAGAFLRPHVPRVGPLPGQVGSRGDAIGFGRQSLAASVASMPSSTMERHLRMFLGREIADETAEAGFLWLDGEIEHPSRVLEDFSDAGHRLGELWLDMLAKDAVLKGLWEKRTKAVTSLPWRLEPADSSPEALQARDFAARMIEAIPDFDDVLGHQMDGILMGLSIDEMILHQPAEGPLAGFIVPREIKDRPIWRFAFVRLAGGGWEMRLRTDLGGQHLKKIPEARFLCMRTGSRDNPWGGRFLIDSAYWLHYLGKNGWKSFAIALEKWGQPTLVGKYPSNPDASAGHEKYTEDQIAELLDTLQAVQTDQALVIPDSAQIEPLEAMKSGSVHYPGFIQLAERGMALLFLGEIDTSGVAQGPGSFAKSRISNEVRLETVRQDARKLSTHLTRSLIAPLVELNLGRSAPVPTFTIESLEAEDRSRRQEAAERMLDRGLPLIRADYYALNQQRMPQPGDETIDAPPPAPAALPTEGFAA